MIVEYKEMTFQLTPRDQELLGVQAMDTNVPVEFAEELLLRVESALITNELHGLQPEYLAGYDITESTRKRVVGLYLRSMISIVIPHLQPSFDEVDDFLKLQIQDGQR